MRTGIIAKKIGMSSFFDSSGVVFPITLLQISDCCVVDHKTYIKHGYSAMLLGAGDVIKSSKKKKPLISLFNKAGVSYKSVLKEFRVSDEHFIDIGTMLKVDHFTVGQFVDVTGTSLGKGFAGSMKRHNFRGLEASHGVSVSHRSHGSTGGRQDPGKVFKNKKMAGHLGNRKVTIQNLKILDIVLSDNTIVLIGSVPGYNGSLVYVKDAVKKQLF